MPVARYSLSGLSALLDDGLIRRSGTQVFLKATSLQDCIRRGACRFLLEKLNQSEKEAQVRAESIRVINDVEVSARFEPITVQAPPGQPGGASSEVQCHSALSETWEGEIEVEWDDGAGVDEHRMLVLLNYVGTTIGLGALRAEVGGQYGRFIALSA